MTSPKQQGDGKHPSQTAGCVVGLTLFLLGLWLTNAGIPTLGGIVVFGGLAFWIWTQG